MVELVSTIPFCPKPRASPPQHAYITSGTCRHVSLISSIPAFFGGGVIPSTSREVGAETGDHHSSPWGLWHPKFWMWGYFYRFLSPVACFWVSQASLEGTPSPRNSISGVIWGFSENGEAGESHFHRNSPSCKCLVRPIQCPSDLHLHHRLPTVNKFSSRLCPLLHILSATSLTVAFLDSKLLLKSQEAC